MKRLLFVGVLVLISVSVFAQSRVVLPNFVHAGYNFKTYTDYTATSDDTSGYVTIDGIGRNVLLGSEVVLVGVGDSVAADVYVIASNQYLTDVAASTYADSILTTGADVAYKVIVVKSPTVNRFPGYTSLKVGTVFRASGQDVSSGRKLRWFVMWKP